MSPVPVNRETRLPLHGKAELRYGDLSYACLIGNVSNRGFLLACTEQFRIGQILELKSERFSGRTMQCLLKVRRSADGSLGTAIVAIDPVSNRLCQEFMQEHFAARVSRGVT